MLFAPETSASFDRLRALATALEAEGAYAEMLEGALNEGFRKAQAALPFPCADIPIAIGRALGGDDERPILAAAIGTSLWIGADILDDLADGDPLRWAAPHDPAAVLVGTNFLAVFPHLLVAGAPHLPEETRARTSAALARATWTMSRGQYRDLHETITSVPAYLDLVVQKSGAEIALLASLPSLLLDGPAAEVAAWERFGSTLGTCLQLFTDTCDLFGERPSRDLLRGKRTLPVLHALGTLEGDERAHLEKVLERAASDDEQAARDAATLLARAGALQAGLTMAGYLRLKAVAALPISLDGDPSCADLQKLIDRILPRAHSKGG